MLPTVSDLLYLIVDETPRRVLCASVWRSWYPLRCTSSKADAKQYLINIRLLLTPLCYLYLTLLVHLDSRVGLGAGFEMNRIFGNTLAQWRLV